MMTEIFHTQAFLTDVWHNDITINMVAQKETFSSMRLPSGGLRRGSLTTSCLECRDCCSTKCLLWHPVCNWAAAGNTMGEGDLWPLPLGKGSSSVMGYSILQQLLGCYRIKSFCVGLVPPPSNPTPSPDMPSPHPPTSRMLPCVLWRKWRKKWENIITDYYYLLLSLSFALFPWWKRERLHFSIRHCHSKIWGNKMQ